MKNIDAMILSLPGPILVIGASGFIGCNLLRKIIPLRQDVYGTIFSGDSWRLAEISTNNLIFLDIREKSNIAEVMRKISPKVIFDCSSFGAYSFEEDFEKIHRTNYLGLIALLNILEHHKLYAYIHAGSSSEYGLNSQAPQESATLLPNSHYAVSKIAAAYAINYYGKIKQMPAINLRLYSVYGAYEDSSRLIPVLCKQAINKQLPNFAPENISRDYVYIDDVIAAFILTATKIHPEIYGNSFNIGSGVRTTMRDLALIAKEIFAIDDMPIFSTAMSRLWDTDNWYADATTAEKSFSWRAQTSLRDGLLTTYNWWADKLKEGDFLAFTKKNKHYQTKKSLTAVIACYKDELAIPIMYERLTNVFRKINMDYQIIFVNDCSPDKSSEIILQLSQKDRNVLGIVHSRNFGSQAAFRSGMEMATMEACVLLDGDLQDPPEIIEEFVGKWREGADIVYGKRIKREMPKYLEFCYKMFYQIFALLSEFKIPTDAGDFSLIDKKAVHWLLECKEKDYFLRGLRAYIGFKQESVDYVRPERMFGVSTNNWLKNIGWAKKAIFSFSRLPLHLLTAFGGLSFGLTLLIAIYNVINKFINPESAPHGVTFLSLLIMFFGSGSILGIGLLGEYLGKIFEETKARPAFIRKEIITRGEILPVDEL